MEFKEAKQVAKELNDVLGAGIRTVAVKKDALVEAIMDFMTDQDVDGLSEDVVGILEAEGLSSTGEAADLDGDPDEQEDAELTVYPETAEEFDKDTFEALKEEYAALKDKDERDADEDERLAYLKATGKMVNDYLKAKKEAEASEPVENEVVETEVTGTTEVLPGEEVTDGEVAALVVEMNTVLNFEEPIDVDELTAEEVMQEAMDNLESIEEGDLTKTKGRVTFSKAAIATLAKLGCEPAVAIQAATKPAVKPADAPKEKKPKAKSGPNGRVTNDAIKGQIRRLCNSRSKYAPFDKLLTEGTTIAAAMTALADTEYADEKRCTAHIAYRQKTGYVITETDGVFHMVGYEAAQ